MDVIEAQKQLKKESAVDTVRRPLAPAEGNNGVGITRRKSLSREPGFRCKSPTASSISNAQAQVQVQVRRSPSPNLTRTTVNPSPQSAFKRAVSAERKRPSSPTNSRPSTPVADTSVEQQVSSKKTGGSKLPESLWPSTMRSLSVSFQSDSISIPVGKKEKPATQTLPVPDRTLRPSSNVAHKQAQAQAQAQGESASTPRKSSTPERKRIPLKGKNSTHQSENSRPVDGVPTRLIEQHRWPSRAGGGKLSSTVMTKSVDLSDSIPRISSSPRSRNSQKASADPTGRPGADEDSGPAGLCLKSVDPPSSIGTSLRKLSAEGVLKNSHKTSADPAEATPKNSQKTSADPAGQSAFDDDLRPPGLRLKSLRRLTAFDEDPRSNAGTPKNSQKASASPASSASPAGQSVSDEDFGTPELSFKPLDDIFLRESEQRKPDCLLSRRASMGALPVKPKLVPGQRLPSSGWTPAPKGATSPVRTRASTPTKSRAPSPARIWPSSPRPSSPRPSSPTKQPSSTTSVLSFISDIKGKKTSQLEDAHQLRLLHNRFLQWRFANTQADAAMYVQKITAEESLYDVWQTNLELWESVIMKRIDVQQLKLELKLNLVLKEQLAYLEDWALLEGAHSASLDGIIKDLEASTLRLPVAGGAKADIFSLKAAFSSAIDVMQAMGSSIGSVLSKVEDANGLVSELAALARQERAMLNECDALLASMAAMQVQEYSLRAQLIQSEQDLKKTRNPLLWAT